MIKLGVHLHQVVNDPGRVARNRWSIATVLADGDDDRFVPMLARANPGVTIILRQMPGNVRDNPVLRAGQLAKRAERLQDWAKGELGHRLDLWAVGTNEPIQEWFGAKPSREAYQLIADYQLRWITELRESAQDVRPLLCVDQGWFNGDGPDQHIEGYYGFDLYREAAKAADGAVVHAYWNRGAREIDPEDMGYWLALRMFRRRGYKHEYDPGGVYWCLEDELRGKPFFITETNSGTDRSYTESDECRADAMRFVDEIIRHDVRRQVAGITWFILDTGDPQFETMRLPAWGDQYWHDVEQSDPGVSPTKVIGGGAMNWGDVWNEYQRELDAFPALAKLAAREGLGEAMTGEYDREVDGELWRFRAYAGGLVGAPVGRWSEARVFRTPEDLPKAPGP